MERYKLRNAPKSHRRRLLLPLSFGIGSFTLLHILDAHLHRHAVGGAKVTPFDLVVLSIDPASVDGREDEEARKEQERRMQRVNEVYTWVDEYKSVRFEDVFDIDENIESVLESHGWTMPKQAGAATTMTNKQRLDAFRISLSTPTTRRDIDRVLLTRLITSFAKRENCEGIFWGDCDTTLAARTLAHVSKGRGYSLSYEINDGMSPLGLFYNFPLRDIFKSELEVYASIALRDVQDVIVAKEKIGDLSNRYMSIEQLMENYVESQAVKYPGIMANIARTVAKLEQGVGAEGKRCALCEMPVGEGQDRPIGEKGDLCYGCARSVDDIKS